MRTNPCFVLIGVLALCAPLSAEETKSFKDKLKEGEAAVKLLYRFENVDQMDFDKEAHASTLRTTLSYETGSFKGVSLFLEGEDVTSVGNDLYNNLGGGSLSNGVTDRPGVADPELTEMNQVFLRIKAHDTTIKLGRHEIARGNQRFVGPVGWRQNHQSFDAVSLTNESLEKVVFSYSFVNNVNRVFGDNKGMASHLVDANVKFGDGSRLSVYAYLLDYDSTSDAGLSTSTYGAQYAARRNLGSFDLLYEVEYADQRDYQDNPSNVDAAYMHGMIGAACSAATVKAGWELLEGSSTDGQFQTPLATLHKFNGWADKFLSTPTEGLEDLYLHIDGKAAKGMKWAVVYHDFGADEGGADYGEELDLLLTWESPWDQIFGVKGAFYDAKDFSVDTDKVIFWTEYSF